MKLRTYKALLIGLVIMYCAFLLFGCTTQKKCLERFPPQIITKDSIVLKDSPIYLRIYVPVPGDSVTMHDTFPCPDMIYHKEFKSASGRTIGIVNVKQGQLIVSCKTDSLNRIIDSLVHLQTKEVYKTETKIVEKPVVKYRMPGWCWWLIIALLVCLCWIFRKPIISVLTKLI
ncbi:hypothetical protein [Pinibacter soli]|uniref:Lipoprotein n=1 Tax=Pinibacter soli TaxID=3044211 RepID=A0ABT6RDR2_9BACT|nr:hypothetical protein [Pinibacter soli]MDI3320009.1 hypothetical protein [Pinibacter soli]